MFSFGAMTSANDTNPEVQYLLFRIEDRKAEWGNKQIQRNYHNRQTRLIEAEMLKLQTHNEKARERIREIDEFIIIQSSNGYVGVWDVSRYYSPIPNQNRYYHGSYEEDFYWNCLGSCFHAAGGTDLRTVVPYTVAACPRELKLGTELLVERIGKIVCVDRGGKIKGRRLDIWAGIGDHGLNKILTTKAGKLKVWLL